MLASRSDRFALLLESENERLGEEKRCNREIEIEREEDTCCV